MSFVILFHYKYRSGTQMCLIVKNATAKVMKTTTTTDDDDDDDDDNKDEL